MLVENNLNFFCGRSHFFVFVLFERIVVQCYELLKNWAQLASKV